MADERPGAPMADHFADIAARLRANVAGVQQPVDGPALEDIKPSGPVADEFAAIATTARANEAEKERVRKERRDTDA